LTETAVGDNQNDEMLLARSKIECMRIWDDCSLDEKLFLHDLATDDIANTKDKKIIRKLIAKGLISYDGSLKFSSGVFRLFVKNFIRSSDMDETVKEHAKGTWSKTKVPLLIFITALLAFIFLTQRNSYAAIASTISGLTAVFTLVSRFFDSMPGKAGGAK
jgi:hypothetical protein